MTAMAIGGGNLQQAMDAVRKQNISAKVTAATAQKIDVKPKVVVDTKIGPTSREVAQDITDNLEEIKKDAQNLERLSDLVMGRRLQFQVNDELGCVVVKIIDPNTEKVIREVPSKDIQKMKLSIRRAMGVIFNDVV